MKVFKVLTLFVLVTLMSCSSKTAEFEYKVVKVVGKEAELMADYGPLIFQDQEPMLNKLGSQGWELIDTYTEIGTKHPNYGNSGYVTGIRSNTRTTAVSFIFKRLKLSKNEN